MQPRESKKLSDGIRRKTVREIGARSGRFIMEPLVVSQEEGSGDKRSRAAAREQPRAEDKVAAKIATFVPTIKEATGVENLARENIHEERIVVSESPKADEGIIIRPENEEGGKRISLMRWFRGKIPSTSRPTFLSLELPAVESERRSIKTSPGIFRRAILAALVIIVVAAIFLSTAGARLTLTLKPRVESITLQDIVAAFDTSVARTAPKERLIPAERLEIDRKILQEFEATGKKFIEERARGKVKIFNKFSSSPQQLVSSTRFLAEGGVLYRLGQAITIPGAKIEEGKVVPQFIEIELVADKPGPGGNTNGELTLHIPGFKGTPKYEGFYAVANAGFAGGFMGEARVVSRDDLKNSEIVATKKIYEELLQELTRKIPPEFKLVDALREIQIKKISAPREGTQRDKFTVEVEAEARALVFREKDIFLLLRELVLKGDTSKDLIPETANLNYKIRGIDFAKGRGEVTIRGDLKVKSIINQTELAEIVSGKKEGTIIETLKGRNDLAAFRLSFFPPWRSKAPQSIGKVKVVVEGP